jgi:ubiquinone/menaquinone biosynthesis C-methylase UbiE
VWKAGLALFAVAGAGAWLIINRVVAVRTRREAWRLCDVLEVGEGSRVADVGAGKGAVALEMARRVGPTGHVYATEIESKRRRQIQSAIKKAALENVSVLASDETKTGLEPNCCDAVYLRGAYHHLTKPAEIDASLRKALRPSGRLAIIDFRPGWFLSTFVPVKGVPSNRGGHGVPPEVVIDELKFAGFVPEQRIENWNGRKYCLTFRRPA